MAKPFDSNTPLLNTIVGTPLYQSPQLLAGKTYTYKCDVWALGMIFYEVYISLTIDAIWKASMETRIKYCIIS